MSVSFINHSVEEDARPRARTVVNRLVERRYARSAGGGVVGDGLAEGGGQGRLEGGLAVAVHRDHVAQDREGVAALGLGVDRLDVEHLAVQRDGEQVAEHHLGVAAALQGERLGDVVVGLDVVLDLGRRLDRLPGRELQQRELPVVGPGLRVDA